MMSEQSFWSVDDDSAEDLWVCMGCLQEVFYRKVPMPDCPACHGVSTYEAFTLSSVREWGTAELIAKAEAAHVDAKAVQAGPDACA
jgi:hypothetical protein